MKELRKDVQSDFGQLLANWRKDLKLTQAKAAFRLGIARPTLQKYESSRQPPPLEEIERLASGMGRSFDELVDAWCISAWRHKPMQGLVSSVQALRRTHPKSPRSSMNEFAAAFGERVGSLVSTEACKLLGNLVITNRVTHSIHCKQRADLTFRSMTGLRNTKQHLVAANTKTLGYSVFATQILPGWGTLHRHGMTDGEIPGMEIVTILEGSGSLLVVLDKHEARVEQESGLAETAEAKCFPLRPGTIACYPGNLFHVFLCRSNEPIVLSVVCMPHPQTQGELAEFSFEDLSPIKNQTVQRIVRRHLESDHA